MEHDGCKGCKYEHYGADSPVCIGCKQNSIDKYKRMTNSDLIRSMSDEKLTEFLRKIELGDIDYSVTFCDLCKDGGNTLGLDCDGCLLHWLQTECALN